MDALQCALDERQGAASGAGRAGGEDGGHMGAGRYSWLKSRETFRSYKDHIILKWHFISKLGGTVHAPKWEQSNNISVQFASNRGASNVVDHIIWALKTQQKLAKTQVGYVT